MFEYLNRKFKILTRRCKIPTGEVNRIVEEESKEIGIPIFTTRNPLVCCKDTSLNAKYLQHVKKIQVCKTHIQSVEDLRGMIQREAIWGKEVSDSMSDDAKTRILIKACKQEINVVNFLDNATREVATELCSKLYLKYKLQNDTRYVDNWHFYTRKLVHDNWFYYNSAN